MSQIKLNSSDGQCFSVDVKIATLSKTIKNMLEDLGTDGLEDEVIPLPNVTAHTLGKILEWAEHHKDEPVVEQQEEALGSNNIDLSDWDKKFLEVEKAERRLIDLLLASNYLDISTLLDTCCKFTAMHIKGKKVEEIRENFQINAPEGYEKPVQDTEASTEASPMETEEEKKEISSENKLDLAASDRPACSAESS